MTTTFTPGNAVGVCGATARMIVGIQLDDPRLARLWEVLARGGEGAVDGALAVLLEGGFAAMPAFAVAASSGTSTRIVVRHPAVVEATVDGAPVLATSTPGGTWSDITVEGASALVLRTGDDVVSTLQLPFHAGMTPAAAVRIVLEPGAGAESTADAAAPAVDSAAPAPAPAPAAPEAAAEPSEAPTADATAAEPAEATPLTAVWHDEPQPDEPAAPAEPPAPPAQTDEPEHATVLRPAPPTPVAPPPPSPPAPTPPTPSAPAAPSGLIDGVPWLTANWDGSAAQPASRPAFETPAPPARPSVPVRSAPTPATSTSVESSSTPVGPSPAAPHAAHTPATPATAQVEGEGEADDSVTVLRSELVAEMGSIGIVGPSVLAVDCPNGHQTSAHEATCRLCGTAVPDTQEPRQIPRPALGALVLASGDRLVLDKDAVLGRAPYEPEGSVERPHLLRVGESGDISRQHARIKLDGWHVSVRDLGTANGTTLTLPGGSPQQLRANEDYQLEDGAEIGIADVVTLRYEVQP